LGYEFGLLPVVWAVGYKFGLLVWAVGEEEETDEIDEEALELV
jgi:hypothetical protein